MIDHTDPRKDSLCLWCGEPLPPRTGKRGRPAKTCSTGDCRRLYHNKHHLNQRIVKYRQSQRLHAVVDRSDVVEWAIPAINVKEYDDELEAYTLDGYGEVEGGADNLHGDALMTAISDWEKSEKIRRDLAECEKCLAWEEREARNAQLDAMIAAMTPEERRERLRVSVRRRLAKRELRN